MNTQMHSNGAVILVPESFSHWQSKLAKTNVCVKPSEVMSINVRSHFRGKVSGNTACYVWGHVAAVQSESPYWPLSSAIRTYNRHMSMEQRKKVIWSGEPCSLLRPVDSCMCASLTWGRDGTGMHHENKENQQRQWNALGDVLLGNPGFWHTYIPPPKTLL